MPGIIGIDPGLAATGIGLVRGQRGLVSKFSFGCIRTEAKDPLPERLDRIFTRLTGVLADEKPDLMVVEDIFSLDRYPKSGILLGKVAGIILLAGFRYGIPVKEIQVREAKQVLTGNGNATKQQLEKSVRHQLKLSNPIRPYHASDALALALIGLFRYTI
ncbi:crossover junction endodeoxyribonuclease RuvC [Desulfobacterales bacterium HSG16]|nr:crossover junction endodeoxyribonuclease RuvC [Desulfobacterales bacterium HSG16]